MMMPCDSGFSAIAQNHHSKHGHKKQFHTDLSGTKLASPNCSGYGGCKRARIHSVEEIVEFFALSAAEYRRNRTILGVTLKIAGSSQRPRLQSLQQQPRDFAAAATTGHCEPFQRSFRFWTKTMVWMAQCHSGYMSDHLLVLGDLLLLSSIGLLSGHI